MKTKKAGSISKKHLVMFLCAALSATACSDATDSGDTSSDELAVQTNEADHAGTDAASDVPEPQDEPVIPLVDPCPGGFFSGSQCVWLDGPRTPEPGAEKPANPLAGALFVINDARMKHQDCGEGVVGPVNGLKLSLELVEAAQSHANDMAANGLVDIVDSEGRGMVERVSEAGFHGPLIMENVGAGFTDTADAAEAWLVSDFTCENLMNADATHMGIGYAESEDGDSYWSLVIGQRD